MLKLINRLISRAYPRLASSASEGQDRADRLIAEGNRAESEGDFAGACERYREAVQAAPGYAKAHLNLGIGLEAAGNADEAFRAYEKALAIDPTDAYASYNLGKLHYARGALAQAERHLRSSIALKADLPEAHLALANTLDSQEKPGAALEELEIALRNRPGHFGALYNKGLILASMARTAGRSRRCGKPRLSIRKIPRQTSTSATSCGAARSIARRSGFCAWRWNESRNFRKPTPPSTMSTIRRAISAPRSRNWRLRFPSDLTGSARSTTTAKP